MAKATTKKGTGAQPSELDKKKALDTAIAQITKAYGAGTIMRLGENANMQVSAVSTGSLMLDMALGIGGVHGDGKFYRPCEDPLRTGKGNDGNFGKTF